MPNPHGLSKIKLIPLAAMLTGCLMQPPEMTPIPPDQYCDIPPITSAYGSFDARPPLPEAYLAQSEIVLTMEEEGIGPLKVLLFKVPVIGVRLTTAEGEIVELDPDIRVEEKEYGLYTAVCFNVGFGVGDALEIMLDNNFGELYEMLLVDPEGFPRNRGVWPPMISNPFR